MALPQATILEIPSPSGRVGDGFEFCFLDKKPIPLPTSLLKEEELKVAPLGAGGFKDGASFAAANPPQPLFFKMGSASWQACTGC